jgi:hypothetical protein
LDGAGAYLLKIRSASPNKTQRQRFHRRVATVDHLELLIIVVVRAAARDHL